ncbi:MAG: protein kinase [Lachnospiraceae bacterium]|nr:protein kinase [Lachnospiraceae bacterium]
MIEKEIEEFNRSYEDSVKSIKLPKRLQKDYKIVDCLKESDIKHVYLLEAADGTLSVLKAYKAEYTSLLENEYHIMEQLKNKRNCPVPKTIDYWTDENYVFFLREYIDGNSLLSMYEGGYFESDKAVIQMSIELCSVIAKLHGENPPIIHRDIKPENFIWNKKDERLYLIDCDSARFYKEGQERDTLFLGTPTHAAPEAYGYAQCDVRSDVYGIGKTILYMCCGRTDDKAVVECDIPKCLLGIIKKSIAFSPEDRYSRVKYIYQDLKKLYDRKYEEKYSFHRIRYGAAMLAAVLLAFGLGIVFDRSVLIQRGSGVVQTVADTENTQGWGLVPVDSEYTGPSLAEASDRVSIEVSGYREYVDRIITCYYEMDLEGMGEAYDELFTELYAAEDLQALEWTDVSKLDEIPENYPYKPYPYRVCDPLACYDNILYTKIGHYEDYGGSIYGFLDYSLNEDNGMTNLPFYQYCNGDASDRETNYKEAFVEVINCALRGVMDQDGLEFLNP